MKLILEALEAVLLEPKFNEMPLATQTKVADAIERFNYIVPIFTATVLKARNDIMQSQSFTWLGGLNDGRMLFREIDKYEKIRNSGCTNDVRYRYGLRPV